MKFRQYYILFSVNGEGGSGAGSGGGSSGNDGGKTVTLTQAEHERLTCRIKELEKNAGASGSDEESKRKISELEQSITTLKSERDEYRQKHEKLETGVRNSYLENLTDEHKNIAKLIPTIEGLAGYVKLNSMPPPAGSDSGKPGAVYKDYSAVNWDDLSYSEKEEMRVKRPGEWKRLYKEKFGVKP